MGMWYALVCVDVKGCEVQVGVLLGYGVPKLESVVVWMEERADE